MKRKTTKLVEELVEETIGFAIGMTFSYLIFRFLIGLGGGPLTVALAYLSASLGQVQSKLRKLTSS